MTTQDPELSAALGWPGGISDPVLDRTRLLQMVAALRLASKQALEALEAMNPYPASKEDQRAGAITALRAALAESGRDWSLLEATQESLREHMAEIHRLRAALAQQAEPVQVAERERIASQWDGCVTRSLDTFGPVDIGASIRAGELVEAQQAEPVEPVAWDVTKDGRLIYDYDFTHDAVLRVMGDFENDEQRVRYAKQIVDKLNAAPAQQAVAAAELRRQHGEIKSMRAERLRSERRLLDVNAQRDALLEALKYHQEQTRPIQRTLDVIKAVEGEKNHG